MKRNTHNFLIFVLIVAIFFNSINLNLYAIENEIEMPNVILSNVSESNTVEESELQDEIGEVERLRDENVKQFYMGDGEYKAIVYATPVHRKDAEGRWQDIDNNLIPNETKSKKIYVTSDGRTTFSGKVNSNDRLIYNLQENGYSISLYFENSDIKNSSAKVSNHEKWNKNANDVEELYKKAKMIDTNTTISYKNILKDIDFEYVLSDDNVKENIIIRAKQDSYEYLFSLRLNGLKPVLCEDGAIYLYDEMTEQLVYEMPAPYAYDAKGSITYDVVYDLSLNDTGYWTLKVTANDEWINAVDRQFPVIIDPTFNVNGLVWDTYINKAAPNQNYGTSENLWLSPREAIFFKFAMVSFPVIPTYAYINQVNFCAYYYFNVSSGTVDIACFSAPLNWSANQLTYNTVQNTCGTALPTEISYSGMSLASAEASSTIREATPGLFQVDITDLFLMWNTGQENYGLILVYNSRSTNNSVVFLSSERGNQYRAYMEISYQNRPALAPLENGRYYVENVEYKTFAQFNDNQKMELGDFQSSGKQSWDITYLRNGYYKIVAVSGSTSSSNALSVPSSGKNTDSILQIEPYLNLETTISSNSKLTFASYDDMSRQQWSIIQTDSGGFVLRPKCDNYATDWCMVSSGARDIIKQGAYTNDSSDADEWFFHDTLDYAHITYPVRLYYSSDCHFDEDELISIYEEAVAGYYEWFSIRFEIEVVDESSLLDFDESCHVLNRNVACSEYHGCGEEERCSEFHHRSGSKLLDLLQANAYYTCRVVDYGLCHYDYSKTYGDRRHMQVLGVGYLNGKDIVVSETSALVNGEYSDRERLICTIQHELMHNFGLDHELNDCSSEWCVMEGMYGIWCDNCCEIVRAHIAKEGRS